MRDTKTTNEKMTMEEIIRASLASGSPFFSPESVATFRSINHSETYIGNYFITSEIMPGEPESTRLWKVRQFKLGRIKTKPQSFPDLKSAIAYAKALEIK